METVVIDNKTYVKASQIAKQFRYTNDYIGQLCRAHKVDCQLVGRTWFVTEASLLEHKDSRYKEVRVNEITSKNSIKVEAGQELVYPRLQKKTLRKLSVTHDFDEPGRQQTRYYTDDEPLVPAMQRRIIPQIPVVPAKATDKEVTVNEVTVNPVHVKVVAAEKPKQKLAFTDIPAVSLRGTLTVAEADVTIDDIDTDFPVIKPISVSKTVPHDEPVAAAPHTTDSHLATVAPARTPRVRPGGSVVILAAFLSSLVLASFFLVASLQMTFRDGLLTASSVNFSPENMLTFWGKL